MKMDGDKQRTLLDNCVQQLTQYAKLIQEYYPEETKGDKLKEVKKLAKAYYNVEIMNQKANAALTETQQHFADSSHENTEDVKEIFKQKLNNIVISQIPFEEHSIMKRLTKAIADGTKSERCDESVICSQASNRPIDPITKVAINVPFKSNNCGHVFDKTSILDYIKSRKGKAVRCPYIGCTNVNMKKEELTLDEKLSEQIKANIWNNSSILNNTSVMNDSSIMDGTIG